MSFAHPLAFSLLLLPALLLLPRRRQRHYLAFNVPSLPNLPPPPWYRSLPRLLLTCCMLLLIGLIAEPMG